MFGFFSNIFKKSTPPAVKDDGKYTVAMPSRQSVLNNTNKTPETTKPSIKPRISNLIDVIKDYDWTYSKNKISKINEIPYVEVREFKMAGNSYMSSLMTSALLFPDIVASTVDKNSAAGAFSNTLKESFADNKFAEFMKNVGNKTSDVLNKLETGAKKASNFVAEQMKAADKTAECWSSDDLRDKYAYLYIRKETGTVYKFPYFDNSFFSFSNSFEETYNSGNSILDKIASRMGEVTKNIQDVASMGIALTEPGMYVQRPKFYDFKSSGISVDVEFYLYNTLTEGSYSKNLELLTKLIIQNTPHRHNRILVDPPCIYELTVPGRGFYPYAYISELRIDHAGTKRMLKNGNGKDTIVPDAYQVKIKFESLVSEVNNFIIPEMGSAGIDVSKRYGVGDLINEANGANQNQTRVENFNPANPSSNQPKEQEQITAPANNGQSEQTNPTPNVPKSSAVFDQQAQTTQTPNTPQPYQSETQRRIAAAEALAAGRNPEPRYAANDSSPAAQRYHANQKKIEAATRLANQ